MAEELRLNGQEPLKEIHTEPEQKPEAERTPEPESDRKPEAEKKSEPEQKAEPEKKPEPDPEKEPEKAPKKEAEKEPKKKSDKDAKKKEDGKKGGKKKEDPKKKPKKKKAPPPPPTPEEIREHALLELEGAELALDFRDRAGYYRKAADLLKTIPEDPESAAKAEEYLRLAEETVENGFQEAYDQAVSEMEHATHAEDYNRAATALRHIEDFRDAGQLAGECERRYRKMTQGSSLRLVAGLLILVLLVAAVAGAQTRPGKYALGRFYQATHHYSAAMNQFKALENYRDSEAQARESRYRLAQEHLREGRYEKAVHHFQKLDDYKDSRRQEVAAEQALLTASEPGDTVPFGGAKWVVLDRGAEQALLLREDYEEDISQPYNRNREQVRWQDSSVCLWLNTVYLCETFSPEEQALLVPDGPENADAPVFFLTADQAETCAERIPHVKDNWWLRDPGEGKETAAFVTPEGTVMRYGCPVDSAAIRVRPAVRVRFAE